MESKKDVEAAKDRYGSAAGGGGAVTARDRCHRCDFPLATDEDHGTIPDGGGAHLCWSAWGGECEAIDWRARALAAVDGAAALRRAGARLREDIRARDWLATPAARAWDELVNGTGERESGR